MRPGTASSARFLPFTTALAWFAVFLGGTFLLAFRIGRESLWYDETYSMAVVEHSFGQIVTLMAGDVHPPLYFLMLKAWVSALGTSPVAARALSALGVLAMAGLGVYPLRKCWPQARALTYSVLCFITPMSIAAGQEIRMYSWLAFFVTATILSGWVAWSTHRRKALAAMVIFSLAAAYTHYFGLLAIGISWAIFLVALAARRHPLLRASMLGAGLVIVAYLPWVGALIGQFGRVGTHYWIDPVSFKRLVWVLAYPFSAKFTVPRLGVFAFVFVFLVIGYGSYRCIRTRDASGILVLAATGIYLLTLGTALAVSLLYQPVLQHRYMLSCLGLLLLALTYGIHSPRNRVWTIALSAFFLTATLPTLAKTYDAVQNGPMHLVRDDLESQVQSGDVFIHNGEHNFGTFSYYFPDHVQYLYLPAQSTPNGNYAVFDHHGTFGDDPTPFLGKAPVIWVTYSSNERAILSLDLFKKAGYQARPDDPQTFDSHHPWYTIRVYRLTRSLAQPPSTESLP